MSTFTADELFIGKLKSLTTDTSVKQLFDNYKTDKDPQWNIKMLGRTASIKKDHLLAAVKLLCSLDDDLPSLVAGLKSSKSSTKPQLAEDIVMFIQDARQLECYKCSHPYLPYGPDNLLAELLCFKCNRPSHKGCLSDYQVDPELGILFLCSLCLSSARKEKTTESDHVSPVEHDTDPPNVTPGASSTTLPNDTPPRVQNPQYDTSKPVCPLLLKGECPHGITGRSSGLCEHYHPPWCHKFTKNGPGGKRGCKNKDKCKYFHPTLCQNGLKMGCCLNDKCTFVHIKGCKRTKSSKPIPVKQSKEVEAKKTLGKNTTFAADKRLNHLTSYSDIVSGKRSRYDSTSSQLSTSSRSQSKRPNSKDNNEDFLKHLAQLKAEMKEMMQEMIQSSLSSLQNLMGYQQRTPVHPMIPEVRNMFIPPQFHHPPHQNGYPIPPPSFLPHPQVHLEI